MYYIGIDLGTSAVKLLLMEADGIITGPNRCWISAISRRARFQSFLKAMRLSDCALSGADIATVPYSVFEQMTKYPLTDSGIDKCK